MWIPRILQRKIEDALKTRPITLVTGARQTGKTSLLKNSVVNAEYVTLDNLLTAMRAEENPSDFLRQFKSRVIIDEIQYAPSLFREIKVFIDQDRSNYGKWFLTGSQKIQLMKGVSESLAGRLRILTLETLSASELRESGYFSEEQIKQFVFKGGYPELWANMDINFADYYEDYIQTYLERDLKEIINVSNLRQFRKMLQFCAMRIGQLMNYAEISKETGVSLNTVKAWVTALEISGIIYMLPPFYANIGKRLVKSPKFFFADHGLSAYLLGIDSHNYETSLYRGALWENMAFSEIIKTTGAIPGRNLFYYRDNNNVEMDFIYDTPSCRYLIEAKASERVDEKKLNFKKISLLLKDKPVKNILMASIQEKSVISMAGCDICNPLLASCFSQVTGNTRQG
jgi:predicted AAA+ superfamily ATPase